MNRLYRISALALAAALCLALAACGPKQAGHVLRQYVLGRLVFRVHACRLRLGFRFGFRVRFVRRGRGHDERGPALRLCHP